MEPSVELFGVVAGIVIGLLGLLQSIFKIHADPKETGNTVKRLVFNRWFLLFVFGIGLVVFFWSQNNKIQALREQVTALQATREGEVAEGLPAQTPLVETVVVTQSPITVTRLVTQPPMTVTQIVGQPPVTVTQIVTQPPMTVTRLVTVTSPAIAPPTPTQNPEILYTEDFEDIPDCWSLEGPVGLNSGRLVATVGGNEWLWLPIPCVTVEGDFYIQAEMQALEGHTCYMGIGIGLGEGAPPSYHSFMLMGGCGAGFTGFYDQSDGSRLFYSPHSGIVGRGTIIIGVEAKNDLFTLYVNGSMTDTRSIERHGNQVGFAMWHGQSGDAVVSIDNIVVRRQK